MPDLLDEADAIRDEHVARGLARIDRAIPAGAPGECDDCGEVMPRLVGGRCAFCRDGRRHPFETSTPRPSTGAPTRVPPSPVKEETMPNAPGTRAISFVASGELLTRIEAQAAQENASPAAFVKAVVAASFDAAPQIVEAERLLLNLAAVPLPDLLDELRGRVEQAAENQALLARATAAEAKLAAIAATLAPGTGAVA